MQTESCAVGALQPFRPWPGCSLGPGPALLQASTLFYSVKLIACALHSYGLRAISSILTCPGLLSLPAGHLHGPKGALIHTLSRVRHLGIPGIVCKVVECKQSIACLFHICAVTRVCLQLALVTLAPSVVLCHPTCAHLNLMLTSKHR